MAVPHVAYISVGSNLGDKLQNCRFGIRALEATPGVRITGRSRFYQTEPVDFTAQDWFVNAVVRIECALDPYQLLERLQTVQREAGRPAGGIRFGPRVLDLDILTFDRLILDAPRLTLPHPRMHQRRFVLQPLCDIDPYLVHPVLGKDMRRLLAESHVLEQQVVELS